MAKERKDTWTEEQDDLLAKIVLEHLTSGSTQTKAFEEAAEKLNRTTAACGFRWNASLRQEYKEEIKQAKAEKVSKSKFANKKTSEPVLKEVKSAAPSKTESKKDTSKQQAKSVTASGPSALPSVSEVEEIKVKHLLAVLESFDKELSIADIEKMKREKDALLKENQELKEEIRSVYLILDRLRRSANIEVNMEQREAN
ncbi:RsfA family transcription factor [Evansella vedderi]|uniref:RsfA family transcription factor n=1 Tax=Evansella vedderi TaxID=38282 RepID=A0ABU0A0Q4_9BACI|nr:hypothetical protein [Evansella vedderi]MDQ0256602.1 RsfA family transcription factor [Evansella vedderi]